MPFQVLHVYVCNKLIEVVTKLPLRIAKFYYVKSNMQFQKISILPPPPNPNPTPYRRDLNFLGGWGVLYKSQKIRKCMKLYWNFQRGGGVLEIPSVGEEWIFSGITQYEELTT